MAVLLEASAAEGVLNYRFSGPITAEDLDHLRGAEEAVFTALAPDACVNIIADMGAIDSIAPSLFAQLQRLRMVADPRVCMVVVVGANSYLRALAISLGVIAPRLHPYAFTETLDEARRLLAAANA